jgi:hypothetical protein
MAVYEPCTQDMPYNRTVLIRQGGVYRIRYQHNTIRVESSSCKHRTSPGYVIYRIETRDGSPPSRVRRSYTGLHTMKKCHRRQLSLPLRGVYILESGEEEFDTLLQQQGYVSMCEYITEHTFPEMYYALLERQARREVVPIVLDAYLMFRCSSMAIPRELQYRVAQYIEAIVSPKREGVKRILE